LITAPDGTTIVSDPYADLPRPAGLDVLPGDLAADVVTVSHAHFDHSNVDAVGGEPRVLSEPGSYQVGMVKIAGYESYEGSPSGPSRIHNTVFVFEIGEVKIVHMGDAGLLTPPDLLAAVDEADVVIVNVDGYVLPFNQLLPQMQAINARTFIPSHYSIDGQDRFYTWATLEEFLQILPSDVVVMREGSEIQVTAGMTNQVLVLEPSALEE
jgi:L-ascorbate metabolism protein UlaG (beta-lactamase superfamily)